MGSSFRIARISLFVSALCTVHNKGQHVNSVAPGSTLFPGGSWDRRQRENPDQIAQFIKDELPLGRFGRPEEVAAVVVFLASQQASLMTGACVTVDGCQSRSLI
jgi:3-oxoacyl-[acyl-carrier protein] reductase